MFEISFDFSAFSSHPLRPFLPLFFLIPSGIWRQLFFPTTPVSRLKYAFRVHRYTRPAAWSFIYQLSEGELPLYFSRKNYFKWYGALIRSWTAPDHQSRNGTEKVTLGANTGMETHNFADNSNLGCKNCHRTVPFYNWRKKVQESKLTNDI